MEGTRFAVILIVGLLGANKAQCNADWFDLPLEELLQVTVTSTSYFHQSLTESASSVSHSDQTRWQELGARNIGELLNTLPSTVAPQGFGRTRVIAIRGYFNFASDTGVATLLDEVPINLLRYGTSALSIDGHDLAVLDNIELIRGPGSSLHGADAFQGVLSMNTVAHGETGVTTQVQAGSEDYQAASLVTRFNDGSQQLTTALAYRNLGDQDLEYPYTDPDTGLDGRGTRKNALENQNLVIKYSVADAYSNHYHLSAYHMNLDADQLPAIARQTGSDIMKDKDWDDYAARLSLLKLGFDHHYNDDFSSSIVAYYWRYSDEEILDLRGLAPAPLNFYQQTDTEEHHWGIKAINRHQFADGSNLAYGYEYNKAVNDDFTTTRITEGGAVNASVNNQQGAEAEYHSLIMDGRYALGLFDQHSSTLVYGSRLDDYKSYDLQISPRLGMIQSLGNGNVTKLTVGRSFRMPNTFEVRGSSSVLPNSDLDPETLDNIELVFQHSSDKLFGSITLFKNKWRDSIRALPETPPFYRFYNTGDNEAWGVELEGKTQWERLRLDGSLSHVKSKNLESDLDYAAFPDWMFNLGVGYRFRPDTDVYVFNRYHHRQAGSVPDLGIEPTQGSSNFFRTDVTFSWQPKADLKTHFTIRNLFDRENYMPGYFDRQEGVPDNGINASLSVEWLPL